MSPKTATISVALFALTFTLTLTLSSAQYATSKCSGYDKVSDILKHYKLPPSIFPGNVRDFSCEHLPDNSLRLTIYLNGVCTVVNELGAIQNALKCDDTISAVVSTGKLTDVKGVTVQLYVKLLPWLPPTAFGSLMTITGAERSVGPFNVQLFKFTSDQGESPPFPYFFFPPDPPKCDKLALEYFYDVNPNKDIPKVSSFGPLNPILVA